MTLTESIVPSVTTGHISDHLRLHNRFNVEAINVKTDDYGAVGDGVTDDSAAITAAIAAASLGAMVYVPAGNYLVDAGVLTLTGSCTIKGDGPDSTWFTLRADSADPMVDVNVPSPSGSVRGVYGPVLEDIGIIRPVGMDGGDCIRIGDDGGGGTTSGWTALRRVRIEGGDWCIDNQATNITIDGFHMLNPSSGFLRATDTGLELRMWDGVLEISPSVVIGTAIEIACASGGGKGALYMRDVALNNLGTVTKGVEMSCPNGQTASAPLRATNVTLDNLAGPGYDLINVSDAQIVGGWVNCAAGTTNGAIRFYGGGGHTIMGAQQLNGGAAGGCTYDFAGGSTVGVVLIGNTPATGPYYRLPGADKPTELLIMDRLSSAAVIGNVTNDEAALRSAMSNMWTPPRAVQALFVRETGTNPPAGYATLVGGIVTVLHANITAATRVRVWRERPGGTTGDIYSSVVDNNPGVHFQIKSTSATDTSSVYWEVYEPV